MPLRRVEGHVTQRQLIRIDGEPREVNSYHRFAAFDSRPPLEVWAVAADGVVKAIRHSAQPITGIMWHPERCAPFSPADVALFRRVFRVRMMRAVILAAGRGSRMGHLGDDRPKCLVELEGKPLIERQIAALRRGGVSEIGVVRGYRAEMIDFPGLFYFANERWAETNMVMSLAAAAPWLRAGPVIVSYADIFYRSELVRGLAGAPGQLVISYDRAWRRLWTRRFADPLADAETFRIDAAGRLLEIGGKTTRIEDIEGQYMGLLKFTPPAWSAVEALLGTLDAPIRDRLDMTGLLRRLLAGKELPIDTFATDGQWGEIDNPEDVALYQRWSGRANSCSRMRCPARSRPDDTIDSRSGCDHPKLCIYRNHGGGAISRDETRRFYGVGW